MIAVGSFSTASLLPTQSSATSTGADPRIAVGLPAFGAVEALGLFVAFQDPEGAFAEAALPEVLPHFAHQQAADADVPVGGLDVEGEDLAGVGRVFVAGGAEGDEAEDLVALDREEGFRRAWVRGSERVHRGAVLHPQVVEVVVVDQPAVGGEPGADVDAGDSQLLSRLGAADLRTHGRRCSTSKPNSSRSRAAISER
jgi:hypothetical protein